MLGRRNKKEKIENPQVFHSVRQVPSLWNQLEGDADDAPGPQRAKNPL